MRRVARMRLRQRGSPCSADLGSGGKRWEERAQELLGGDGVNLKRFSRRSSPLTTRARPFRGVVSSGRTAPCRELCGVHFGGYFRLLKTTTWVFVKLLL